MNKINPFDESGLIVLCNGSFPTAPELLQMLGRANMVVCCDGAADKLLKWGRTPDLIVGDGDSLSAESAERFSDRLYRVPDQDTNDQTKTVHYLMNKGYSVINIIGATGGRDDHAISNLSLLIDYMQEGITVRSFTNEGVFVPISSDTCFSSFKGQQVSVFNFGATSISSNGLKYPLYIFAKMWQGSLNECESDSFTIHTNGPLLVFLTRFSKK